MSALAAAADPIARIALGLGLLLVAGRAAGELATRLGQPQVIGELGAGILLGAIPGGYFRALADDPVIDALGRLGALVLLFEVGIASTVREVTRVGFAALRVAVLGTVASLLAGAAIARWMMPASPTATHLFLGVAIAATSVGITARVLKDLGHERSPAASTILGAAVLDDILALLALSMFTGVLAHGGGIAIVPLVKLVLKSMAFLVLVPLVGMLLVPRLIAATARLRTPHALVVAGLALCLLLSWAADAVGLSPIVGAFAAGLVLEEAQWAPFVARGERGLEEHVEPIASFLVPLFFVLLGTHTDLSALGKKGALGLALGLTIAALLGKLAAGLGARTDRLAVAFGMIPRGEVTLIFASIGVGLVVDGRPLLGPEAHSALVVVVVATTLIAPPALAWRLRGRP